MSPDLEGHRFFHNLISKFLNIKTKVGFLIFFATHNKRAKMTFSGKSAGRYF